jgi:hypothetical protein
LANSLPEKRGENLRLDNLRSKFIIAIAFIVMAAKRTPPGLVKFDLAVNDNNISTKVCGTARGALGTALGPRLHAKDGVNRGLLPRNTPLAGCLAVSHADMIRIRS